MGSVLEMGEVLQLRPQYGMARDAVFSEDRVYRYVLTRVWDDIGFDRMVWILLNPSTADEKKDDPTIRRCIAFARAWGYGGMELVNLFAYRSTNPDVLPRIPDPFGPLNLAHIAEITRDAPLIVCGWGRRPPFDHDKRVLAMLRQYGRTLHCLGTNGDGTPAHPLYLRGDLTPQLYEGRPDA